MDLYICLLYIFVYFIVINVYHLQTNCQNRTMQKQKVKIWTVV